MKYVYICSPLSGDIEKNTENAKRYCRWVYDNYKDTIPIAPHIYFPQFLDDTKPEEREYALQAGLKEIDRCDEMFVFGNYVSEGMKREIEYGTKPQVEAYMMGRSRCVIVRFVREVNGKFVVNEFKDSRNMTIGGTV